MNKTSFTEKTDSLKSAPLWKRLFSTLYDMLILAAVSLAYFALATAVSTLLLGHEAESFKPNATGLWVQIGWLFTIIGFYCFFWCRVGQTVAMKAWRLKLVMNDQSKVTPQMCVLRCIVGFLGFAAFGLGYFWAWIDRDGKALHDRLTKSTVTLLSKAES